MNTTQDGGHQQGRGLRGDHGADRREGDGTRDTAFSDPDPQAPASPVIEQGKDLATRMDSQCNAEDARTAAGALPDSTTEQTCEACGGDGQMVIGEHYVTSEMASDAEEPSMAGSFYGYAYGPCDHCGGSGVVDAAIAKGEGRK